MNISRKYMIQEFNDDIGDAKSVLAITIGKIIGWIVGYIDNNILNLTPRQMRIKRQRIADYGWKEVFKRPPVERVDITLTQYCASLGGMCFDVTPEAKLGIEVERFYKEIIGSIGVSDRRGRLDTRRVLILEGHINRLPRDLRDLATARLIKCLERRITDG